VIEPQATPLTESAGEGSPMLRGEGGAVSHAPAFLGRSSAPVEAPAAADGEEVKKPRRRRAPRSFEGGEGAPPATESEDA
jgi:hypothetical protein